MAAGTLLTSLSCKPWDLKVTDPRASPFSPSRSPLLAQHSSPTPHTVTPRAELALVGALLLPCVALPLAAAETEAGCSSQLVREKSTTQTPQFPLEQGYLVSAPQPMAMHSCTYPGAGTAEEAAVQECDAAARARWDCFTWQQWQLVPVKSNDHFGP